MLARWALTGLCAVALYAQQSPEAVFRGRVIDGETGRGLENVLVVLRDLNAGKVLPSGKTDSKGEVSIPAKAGDYLVYLSLDAYADTAATGYAIRVTPEQPAHPLMLSMIRSGSISGIVEDAEGHPLPEAKVAVLEAISTGFAPRVQSTGPDGRFSFKLLPPGNYLLRATPPVVPVTYTGPEPGATFFPSSPDGWGAAQITVVAGIEIPNLRLRLRTANYFTVSGKVVNPDDADLRDMVVHLNRDDNPRMSIPADRNWELESYIEADGTFRIEHVQEGAYVAKVLDGGPASPVLGAARVVVEKGNIDDLRVPVLPRGTLTWNIVLEDGSPVVARTVTLQGWNEGRTQTSHISARLAKPPARRVVFSTKDVPAGNYRISVPGFAVTKVQIGGQTYEGGKFEFADRGTVVATVTVSETGATIRGSIEGTRKPDEAATGTASVALISGFADHLSYYSVAPLTGAGEFSFSQLEPGSYAVCAWMDGVSRVTGLLRSGNVPLENLRPHCKTVTLKTNGSESVRVVRTSIEKVVR